MREGDILAGKYRLIRRLGKGAEGSVYLAIHLQTEMFWAIKEVRTGRDGSGAGGGAACHELQIMKSLRMRHLPQIIDVLQEGGSIFLVMEHVRGVPLNQRIRDEGILSYKELLDTAEQVTEALCYLESREKPVCHLDIKPSNLIRRPDGLIKLVDFGSAWKEKEQMRQMGTEGYAAPEQYVPGAKPDVRTDIYALGATLYRLSAGVIWRGEKELGAALNCPEQMRDLILRCLREDPSDRFQSAFDLKKGLENIRKKERRERGRLQLLGALAMALPAAALCVRIFPSVLDLSADETWNYEKLIREAGVVSEEESRDYYRKAIFMKPGHSEAYLAYLEDAGQDGIFSGEEELFLRDTLHSVRPGSDKTYEELLREQGEAYAETALQIGLSYWYTSPREDRRRIAMGWFAKAAEADKESDCSGKKRGEAASQEQSEAERRIRQNRERAQLYLRLGSTLERLNTPSVEEAVRNAREYWNDLEEILEAEENGFLKESELMQMTFSLEALHTITFLSGDLARAGIGREEQVERIRQLEQRCLEERALPGLEKVRKKLQEEAREAVRAALEMAEHEQAGQETEGQLAENTIMSGKKTGRAY